MAVNLNHQPSTQDIYSEQVNSQTQEHSWDTSVTPPKRDQAKEQQLNVLSEGQGHKTANQGRADTENFLIGQLRY